MKWASVLLSLSKVTVRPWRDIVHRMCHGRNLGPARIVLDWIPNNTSLYLILTVPTGAYLETCL
jgi:hypothetical protein